MYIKQITIHGFRSYKSPVVIGPLDPAVNVIVGHNGAGKSNIFNAIQFALGDDLSDMESPEADNKLQMIHESHGARELTASVELLFASVGNDSEDQEDYKAKEHPGESGQPGVQVRRTLTGKKDQYYIGNKCVTKTEINNFLEEAGFVRSNPYYVVKQGKISQLSLASDAARLQLLCEVAGTKTFDDKKASSQQKLDFSLEKKTMIGSMLDYLHEKVRNIRVEQKGVEEFENLSKKSKVIEHIMLHNELEEIRTKNEDEKEKRDERCAVSSELRSKIEAEQNIISELEHDKITKLDAILDAENRKKMLELELESLCKERFRLESGIKDDCERELEEGNNRKELESLRTKILEIVMEIEKSQQILNRLIDNEQKQKNKIASADNERKMMLDKQAEPGTRFASSKARDSWIQQEVDTCRKTIARSTSEVKELRSQVKTLQNRAEGIEQDHKKKNDIRNSRQGQLDEYREQFTLINADLEDSVLQKGELGQKLNEQRRLVQSLEHDVRNVEAKFRQVAGRSIQIGCSSLEKMLNEFEENETHQELVGGYFGVLADNIRCDDTYYSAIEAAAGSRLFYHIVDTDQTATSIIRSFNDRKLPGEINFLPLNVLHVPGSVYSSSSSGFAMIEKLEFDTQRVGKAVAHVFNKVMVCRNLQYALLTSKSMGVNCVTLKGDQVYGNGLMKGGHTDSRNSKLVLRENLKRLTMKLEVENDELNTLKDKLSRADGFSLQLEYELQSMQSIYHSIKMEVEKYGNELKSMELELKGLRDKIAEYECRLYNVNSGISQHKQRMISLNDELKRPFTNELSQEDHQRLQEINRELMELNRSMSETVNERMSYERKISDLADRLKNAKETQEYFEGKLTNTAWVRSPHGDLTDDVTCGAAAVDSDRLRDVTMQSQLDAVVAKLEAIEQSMRRNDDLMADMNVELSKLEADIQNANGRGERMQMEMSVMLEKLKNISLRQKMLVDKEQECNNKLKRLGKITDKDTKQFTEMDSKSLIEELKKCNEQLKKMSPMNRTVFGRYDMLADEHRQLIERSQELDRDAESIKKLIQNLDDMKQRSIHMTFKQVALNFSELWNTINVGFCGQLVLQKASVKTEDYSQSTDPKTLDSPMDAWSSSAAAGTDDRSDRSFNTEKFKGVSIRLKLSAGNDNEVKDMNRLSGGQKALVAMVLILAIQKCDPAPFYLFDEIDQSLDKGHRTALAAIVKELAGSTQFLITSFRPELVGVAQKHFIIASHNQMSKVKEVDRATAESFIFARVVDAEASMANDLLPAKKVQNVAVVVEATAENPTA